jgi:hypothetical protein
MTTSQLASPTVADAIQNTLEWLDTHTNTPDAERRTNNRNRYRVSARIHYSPAGSSKDQFFDVMTRNLSRTGLSFIHKTLIYPRQIVTVELPLPDHSVRNIKARVIRIRPAGQGLYEIGVEFTELEVAVAA